MGVLWILDPCKSVGPFVFGEPISIYVGTYGLRKIEESDITDLTTYAFAEEYESKLYAEGGRLESVGCFDSLSYKGKELFGMTLDEVRAILGPEDEMGESILNRSPVEFTGFGLQVWFSNGLVDSVMCGPFYEE